MCCSQIRKRVTPVLKVSELVEAGTGRAQKETVACAGGERAGGTGDVSSYAQRKHPLPEGFTQAQLFTTLVHTGQSKA